jgi:hypothetical protein
MFIYDKNVLINTVGLYSTLLDQNAWNYNNNACIETT